MTNLAKRIQEQLISSAHSMQLAALIKKLGITRAQRGQFFKALNELVANGSITFYKGKYGTLAHSGAQLGEVVKVTATFGFVTLDEQPEQDVFVPGAYLSGALPGDKVLIRLDQGQRGELPEGRILQIIEEHKAPFAARVEEDEHGQYMVFPDSYVKFPILLAKGKRNHANVGDKVLATVVTRGSRHNGHRVAVVEVFGDSGSAEVCAEAILAEHNIIRAFPPEAAQQAKELEQAVIHPKEIAKRLDLRDENIFTIDSASTKDIDDAVSLKATDKGWQLGVHIADVSYYVTRKSPLDEEAFERGTSVYFANQVVPMLPPELSNGICSLNPQEDRLAFSALIDLDKKGKIRKYAFHKTVIRSKLKGVYEEINRLFEEAPPNDLLKKYHDQLEPLHQMKTLAALLQANRTARHSIELEAPESIILVGENGKAVDILPRQSGLSEHMIEEFMLTANEAAATFAEKLGLPFVYRVHGEPDPEKLETLFQMMDMLGVSYQRPNTQRSVAVTLAGILESVKDTPLQELVNYSVLRSMAKAKYSPQNMGHFGLGLKHYAHFTSPIRRYPDLAIHRILSAVLTGMNPTNVEKHFRSWVVTASQQSSNREVAAIGAERSIEDCYKAEYMQQFIGQDFIGTVASVKSFGIFIRLENTVEGFLRSENFPPGRWSYDNLITYQNEVGGHRIRVGDSIAVRLQQADVALGQIDFVFANPQDYTSAAEGSQTIIVSSRPVKKSADNANKRPKPKLKGQKEQPPASSKPQTARKRPKKKKQ